MKCYLFDTEAACIAALAAMHAKMAEIAAARGFIIINGHQAIGRNAATGQPVPEALTTRWADPAPTHDGRWLIPSVRSVFQTTYPLIEAAAGVTEGDYTPPPLSFED